MSAALVTAALTSVVFVGALVGITWVGLRDGDEPDDIQVAMETTAAPQRPYARLQLTNPSDRSVVVAIRLAPAGRLARQFGQPGTVRTKILRSSSPPRGSRLQLLAPRSTHTLHLPAGSTKDGARMVRLAAYQKPGRVRVITRLLKLRSSDTPSCLGTP